MPSGYVRVKGPDTVVLQVQTVSSGVWSSPVFMPGPVTSYTVNKEADIDTVVSVSNRDSAETQIDVKVQLQDGDNVANTFVMVPGFGMVQIPLSQFFS